MNLETDYSSRMIQKSMDDIFRAVKMTVLSSKKNALKTETIFQNNYKQRSDHMPLLEDIPLRFGF